MLWFGFIATFSLFIIVREGSENSGFLRAMVHKVTQVTMERTYSVDVSSVTACGLCPCFAIHKCLRIYRLSSNEACCHDIRHARDIQASSRFHNQRGY